MSPSTSILLATVLFACATRAHVRWDCPTPRSDGDNIKQGPCGVRLPGILSNDVSRVQLSPGPLTVRFEETIHHTGSPYRIALSRESEDEYEECILLNHIPHFESGSRGSVFYDITVDIPDVQCENCALQLIEVMTDQIGFRSLTECNYDVVGSAGNSNDPENCFSNYHSCTNVRINGSTPRNSFTCSQPADWPYNDLEDFRYAVREVGDWEAPVPLVSPVQLQGISAQQDGGRTVPARFNDVALGCNANFVAVNRDVRSDQENGAMHPGSGVLWMSSTYAYATIICLASSALL